MVSCSPVSMSDGREETLPIWKPGVTGYTDYTGLTGVTGVAGVGVSGGHCLRPQWKSSHQLTLQQNFSAAEGAKRCDFTSPTPTAHISNLSENMKPQIGARCCKGLIIGWIGSQGISIGYEVVTSHSSV